MRETEVKSIMQQSGRLSNLLIFNFLIHFIESTIEEGDWRQRQEEFYV